MAECPAIGKCPFFSDKMAGMSATASQYKTRYCLEDNRTCARWTVRTLLGPAAVPVDLFPNQLDRAKSIAAA